MVIGQILIGRITKLMAFGSFARLDGPVEGLIHISELSNRRIQHPKEVVKEGDVVPVKLVRIERDRHRLGLSLRQARSDAEAMGFVFDHQGQVIDWPDDVREQFNLGARDKSVKARQEPKTTAEAIQQAVAREPETVSAFAHAFQQALENAENSSIGVTVEQAIAARDGDEEAPADSEVTEENQAEVPEVAAAEAAAPEMPSAEAPASEMDSADETAPEMSPAEASEPEAEVEEGAIAQNEEPAQENNPDSPEGS
jgi:predicted RNA-binding protein with RPS1 domain